MEKTIVEPFLKNKETNSTQEYSGKERRMEDDPSYFGHFSLEGLERRQAGSIFS